MIYVGSRYEYSLIDYFSISPKGDENAMVFYDFPSGWTIDYLTYTWKDGDRLDTLANKFYERSSMWWVIMDYNPQITDIFNIPAGTIIKVPRV